jgi:hypothetical protein
MPRMSRAARLGLTLLAAAACVNLGAGAMVSIGDPARAADVWSIYDWCGAWLAHGRSLYTAAGATTDYPPNAIVLLAPLALVPARWLVPFWTAVALALTPVLPWIVMRAAAGPDRDARALERFSQPWRGALVLRRCGEATDVLVVPLLAYLCWAAPRTLLQFTLLSLTLAWAALVIADRRWVASGVALGLALFKPHIAGPIALWMLVTGRLRALAIAIAVVGGGWALYDVRVGENPLTTAVAYWHVLGSQYAGADGLIGDVNLRGWALMMTPDPGTGDMLWIALAALLLAGICWLAARDRSRALDAGGVAIPAMFCLWSLLVTYHNGNNLILMLPAFAFLWFGERWIAVAILEAALIYDVPVRLRGAASSLGWGGVLIEQFDRLLVLTALIYVSVLWYRLSAKPAAARAARSPR